MNFDTISTTWALLKKTAKILILTEAKRLPIAEKIKSDNLPFVAEVAIIDINVDNSYDQKMHLLSKEDLLIVLLTVDGFMNRGYSYYLHSARVGTEQMACGALWYSDKPPEQNTLYTRASQSAKKGGE